MTNSEAKRIKAELIENTDNPQKQGWKAMQEVKENPEAAAKALTNLANTIAEQQSGQRQPTMIQFLKDAITDDVYGRELENAIGLNFVFSMFALSVSENISVLFVIYSATLSALYVKYPSLQESLQEN